MIRVLDKNVADKIAAGEVVERPLSIVKELVENSIDSGANSIVIEIKNGGKSYIRVTDNGSGIPREQVETAFLRHATSKIEKAADLNAIETLGFRGEALASIAAVTHTELITKTSDSKVGTKVLIHGGEIIENAPTGCPDGTTVIVSDLFYNTPARLKFLKSDSAESSRVIEFVSEIALAYNEIKFRLINNGNIVFSTLGDGNGLNTIMSVFQQNEYKNLVHLDYSQGENRVHGYISNPSLSRTTRKDQIFFVNGRVINSKIIEKGVNLGYKERLFDNRYPITFLFIETDPKGLDVNIHPNKREVRFDDEQVIIDLVSNGIISALSTKEAVVEVKNPFKKSDEPNGKNSQLGEQVDIKHILSTKRETPKVSEEKTIEIVSQKGRTIEPVAQANTVSETGTVEHVNVETPNDINVERPANTEKPRLTIEEPMMKPFDFNDLKLTGAIFGTYITATDDTNFYLIDQHAAHERVFYEKLVGEYLSSEKLKQTIISPIIIEVPLSVKETEYDWLDSLSEMGFSIEDFGQNSYTIKEIPTFMTLSEAEDFVKEYVENIREGTNLDNTVVINKLITRSCKSAVKAHDYLSMEEMTALIEQLKTCRNPFSCPHGRPTFIKFSTYEIEKMFKRV